MPVLSKGQLWNEVLALESRIQAILGGKGLDPADEELIDHVKAELTGYRHQIFNTEDFLQHYIRYWMPSHASTLRAVNNRYGRYGPGNVDIYYAADWVAEVHMSELTRRLKDEIKGVIARLDINSAPNSDLKPIARAFQDSIDTYFNEFTKGIGTKLQDFVEEQALAAEEFWQPVQNRWGRGPGYKIDVINMYQNQLSETHTADKFREIAERDWKQSFMQRILNFFG